MFPHIPYKFLASLISFGFTLCGFEGCAIHPLPENVTGVRTPQIVQRNRCEARDALRHIADYFDRILLQSTKLPKLS